MKSQGKCSGRQKFYESPGKRREGKKSGVQSFYTSPKGKKQGSVGGGRNTFAVNIPSTGTTKAR